MKRLYNLFILVFTVSFLNAQLDTLVFEDFQISPFLDMDTSATGTNSNWVNYDADGLTTAFQTEESKKWFHEEFFINPIDPTTGEINFIAASLSFLQGSLPGNRNWLILPPIEVTDESFMLYWESAPAQMPRYMDGYTVLLSKASNDINGNDYTDTLFVAASMDEIIGNSQSTDYSNFTFTSGYLHADGGTNTEYFVDNGGTVLNGLLEPHSVSLEAYVGETIYIAFLHDSDDDERIGLDDILVTKMSTSNTNEGAIQELRMECYPNPADHRMHLVFKSQERHSTEYQIINGTGQVIENRDLGELPSGTHQVKLNVNQLPSGSYFIQLKVGETIATQSFIKR